MSTSIHLKKVNLHYSSLAFRETSLKSYLFKLVSAKKRFQCEDVHALKNVNLKIHPGERVALLGHNGAGKSTLLKTIAGLYPISSGRRVVRGKIRALFDLHLGLEAEATGRENIIYRGLMLGKTLKEMKQIQESIIEFADIGDFINYPIKTYSAGMVMRLAFAISTMTNGDILLLDEIIAAGDVDFMVKAKAKIAQLIETAEIIVLAVHDFSSVKQLCNRTLVLDKGTVIFDGSVDEGISAYQATVDRVPCYSEPLPSQE